MSCLCSADVPLHTVSVYWLIIVLPDNHCGIFLLHEILRSIYPDQNSSINKKAISALHLLHTQRVIISYKLFHLLVGAALQQQPTILCYEEDGLQVDGKGDRVNAAFQHIQHLQLVSTDTRRHQHTAQWWTPAHRWCCLTVLESLTLPPYRRGASSCGRSHGTFYVLPSRNTINTHHTCSSHIVRV